ncbi:MAG TPA: hypothetical protein VF229_08265 [Burkholderiaceae bacterium]
MPSIARLLGTRHRRWRRAGVAVLLVLGGLLILGSVAARSGLIIMILGFAIEAAGLALENRDR